MGDRYEVFTWEETHRHAPALDFCPPLMECPRLLARPVCAVLESLGSTLKFELAVGMNGQVYFPPLCSFYVLFLCSMYPAFLSVAYGIEAGWVWDGGGAG